MEKQKMCISGRRAFKVDTAVSQVCTSNKKECLISRHYIASYSRGRANWLFADTILGAEVNAAMYSIVETAKANHVNPYEYIKYLLEKIPDFLDDEGNVTDPECLKDVMPWSDAFHEYEHECMCRRNSLYSSMFPEPMVPKPPKKATSLAPDAPVCAVR